MNIVELYKAIRKESLNLNNIEIKECDWEALINFSASQLTVVDLREKLITNGLLSKLPPDVRQFLDGYAELAKDFHNEVDSEIQIIGNALHAKGLEAVLLKGGALNQANYYTVPGIRQCFDIDLLSHPEHIDETLTCLESIGYSLGIIMPRPIPADLADHYHHLPRLFKNNGHLGVELHLRPIHLTPFRQAPINSLDIWSHSHSLNKIPGLRAPCPEHLLLHCLHHSLIGHKSIYFNKTDLRAAIDIESIATQTTEPFNETIIIDGLKKCKIIGHVDAFLKEVTEFTPPEAMPALKSLQNKIHLEKSYLIYKIQIQYNYFLKNNNRARKLLLTSSEFSTALLRTFKNRKIIKNIYYLNSQNTPNMFTPFLSKIFSKEYMSEWRQRWRSRLQSL